MTSFFWRDVLLKKHKKRCLEDKLNLITLKMYREAMRLERNRRKRVYEV
jgi:hypothetical protein